MDLEKIYINGLKSAYNDVINEINTIFYNNKYIDETNQERPLYSEHQDILEAIIRYIEKKLKNLN